MERKPCSPIGAMAFIDELAARLAHPGYALLIDYGGVGEPGGPPHGYRSHRPVEDLLARPGSTDITSGIDFDLVATRAEAQGLIAFPSVTQRHALTSLGFDRWVHEQLRGQAELLNRHEGLDAVRAWSGRSRASLLVDPSALGRLRWLLLATPGLTPPHGSDPARVSSRSSLWLTNAPAPPHEDPVLDPEDRSGERQHHHRGRRGVPVPQVLERVPVAEQGEVRRRERGRAALRDDQRGRERRLQTEDRVPSRDEQQEREPSSEA